MHPDMKEKLTVSAQARTRAPVAAAKAALV
jgi:hypothetical protein